MPTNTTAPRKGEGTASRRGEGERSQAVGLTPTEEEGLELYRSVRVGFQGETEEADTPRKGDAQDSEEVEVE